MLDYQIQNKNNCLLLYAILVLQQSHVMFVDKEIRDIEMKLQSADEIIINPPNHEQSINKLPSRAPPTSILLIKKVTVGDYPLAVCQYKGYTYVGCLYGAVDRIDEGGNVTSAFIKLASPVTGIDVYEDRLYTLMRGNPCTVYVHNLAGQQIHCWKHEDGGGFVGQALTVINNELIIADGTNKRFTIYTLTGEHVRDVPCDLITQNYLTICDVGNNSVLVANYDAEPELYRVNLTTGYVEWRSDRVYHPVGVVMRSKDYALVTSFGPSNQVKIWTLNADTGKLYFILFSTGKIDELLAYSGLCNSAFTSQMLLK